MLIRKKSGEVIDVDSEEILDASDFAALIGREDDPVVTALVSEIRRMNSILANQQPPTVNVSPTPVSVTTPQVSVQPNVMLNTPTDWVVKVVKRDYSGRLEEVRFSAVQ